MKKLLILSLLFAGPALAQFTPPTLPPLPPGPPPGPPLGWCGQYFCPPIPGPPNIPPQPAPKPAQPAPGN